jgi:hypothetical protein
MLYIQTHGIHRVNRITCNKHYYLYVYGYTCRCFNVHEHKHTCINRIAWFRYCITCTYTYVARHTCICISRRGYLPIHPDFSKVEYKIVLNVLDTKYEQIFTRTQKPNLHASRSMFSLAAKQRKRVNLVGNCVECVPEHIPHFIPLELSPKNNSVIERWTPLHVDRGHLWFEHMHNCGSWTVWYQNSNWLTRTLLPQACLPICFRRDCLPELQLRC